MRWLVFSTYPNLPQLQIISEITKKFDDRSSRRDQKRYRKDPERTSAHSYYQLAEALLSFVHVRHIFTY